MDSVLNGTDVSRLYQVVGLLGALSLGWLVFLFCRYHSLQWEVDWSNDLECPQSIGKQA